MSAEINIRDARDDDGDALIELIHACWADYPGCVLDVDGENPELRCFASHYRTVGGRAWIAEKSGKVVGSAAVEPASDGAHIQTLYVDPALRRQGLARRLIDLVEEEAKKSGAGAIDLWTDTRFTAAHAFYERLGYRRQPGTRSLDDASRSVEYNYVKTLPVA
ncbi:MAG: GNAT family N-acetyltransferase [Proteobacteria bacterium]|nr:GNAT family N-acetyltransferase [Pseudomonadota bacterium]